MVLSLAPIHAADADFWKWWPHFQAAVARSEAKAVAEGVQFPLDWENGPIRKIESQADFEERFHAYVTPEIKKMITTRKPEKSGKGEYIITWKARGNEYSVWFVPRGSGYALGGLSEGPP